MKGSDVMPSEEDEAARRYFADQLNDSPMDPPSGPQVSYAMSLLKEREWPTTYTQEQVEAMERPDVSALITGLKAAQRKEGGNRAEQKEWDFPPGRYAIQFDAHGGTQTEFYQVDMPKEGRWKGYTFVKQLFGAPGDFRREQVRGFRRDEVLQEISEDPRGASFLFGRELGQCGVCSSPLTNEESRIAGIGPVCAKKTGWIPTIVGGNGE